MFSKHLLDARPSGAQPLLSRLILAATYEVGIMMPILQM